MNEPFQRTNSSYFSINKWQESNPNLRAGFTTRKDGVSSKPFESLNLGFHVEDKYENVLLNRQIIAKQIGVPLENWVFGEQIHHNYIHIAQTQNKGDGATSYDSSLANVDGLITNEKGIMCSAFFADCVPLYFFDPQSGYVGIAHAGWRGTVQQIAKKMIETYLSLNIDLKHIQVVIGPSISREKYEVDESVIKHINVENSNAVQPLKNNRFLLDLKQLNVEILLQAGVFHHNIEVTNYCTYTDEGLFFSHRRDQGKTGRMLGFIGYVEQDY